MREPSNFFSLDECFELKIKSLKNLKTDSLITRPDISSGERAKTEIISIDENGVVLAAPKYSCSEDNDLEIVIEVKCQDGCSREIEATGTVLSTETLTEKSISCKVEFNKFHSNEWLELVDGHNRRQQQLVRLLKAIKE